ncbi:MAG: hypothetical protein EOR09_18160 [Mesorhizobium sp.]|nr:MAG: hypothetical protein EOR09_18160 [Mesorhizobium sp.]
MSVSTRQLPITDLPIRQVMGDAITCRNRHCPMCQGLARAQWLAERHAELLSVPYFHVASPSQLIAEIAFQNKAAVYAILFSPHPKH